MCIQHIHKCMQSQSVKRDQEFEGEGRGKWEGFDRKKGKEECCDYIIISSFFNLKTFTCS